MVTYSQPSMSHLTPRRGWAGCAQLHRGWTRQPVTEEPEAAGNGKPGPRVDCVTGLRGQRGGQRPARGAGLCGKVGLGPVSPHQRGTGALSATPRCPLWVLPSEAGGCTPCLASCPFLGGVGTPLDRPRKGSRGVECTPSWVYLRADTDQQEGAHAHGKAALSNSLSALLPPAGAAGAARRPSAPLSGLIWPFVSREQASRSDWSR